MKFTEEQREQVSQAIGKPVFIFDLLLNDEGTDSTHAMVTKPPRHVVSAWLATKDRDVMQATEMVMKEILITHNGQPMFDPNVLIDDELFFQCYPLVRQLMMVRQGELKKNVT